ncbi:MAG: GDP-mannose 4,6-dehydratase [Thermoguttaceae bacterium]|nr:GDP-mannose 4,6-dehydratase [Thermoguttaceae bacterium]
MKNCLVTGGAGFIGSHLVEALLRRGDRVTVIDDESTGSFDNLAAVKDHPRFAYRRGTVADPELLRSEVAEADEVYHLAAAVGVALIARSAIRTIETNIDPTQRLLVELARVHAAGRPVKLFLASTSEVYGKNPKPVWTEDDDLVLGATIRPRWSYGASKAIDEFLALAYWQERGLPVVVGRLFNVVGPRQTGAYGMVLPRFVDAALAARPLVVHDDGQQQRSFAHVAEVVEAILRLMDCEAAVGRIFNIGSDQPVTILELARRVIRQVDPQLKIEFQSYAEAYGKHFEDCRHRVPDLTRLREAIGFAPQGDLDATIDEIVAWRRGMSRFEDLPQG